MRSLIIGILLFLVWSSLSTWYYATRIYSPDNELSQELVIGQIAEPVASAIKPESPSPPEATRIYFAFDRSDFIPDEKLAAFLNESKIYLQSDTASCLLITGHADSKGTEKYNLELGMKRANSVKGYFLTMGLANSCIKTLSKGESEPMADNSTEEGRAKNRRAILEIQY